MKVALIGAELEENLGLRYMASSLEKQGHQVEIVPFNSDSDIESATRFVINFQPAITGLSMVFTGRAREFCRLAEALRAGGYRGHVIAGGHFASLNCEWLLNEFPAFDSVGLGEGEEMMCRLADSLVHLDQVAGICYRAKDGEVLTNSSTGNPDNLDDLPFPKRTKFHSYYDKPIASILTSRGCWRDCAFCSINAWYKQGGGKKFRIRSVENILEEMKLLYFEYGVRIFNFQDDNFFLPNPLKAVKRFEELRDGLRQAGVEQIAIAVKARPDSITRESIAVLDSLGLFRVFLGVENASQRGLNNLNRKSNVAEVLNALSILNDFDVHVAYNLLMFEPDTILDDILINLRFIERHIENPFNFCRAEAYAGTGWRKSCSARGRLLGDAFGFDYRLKDLRSESFHQLANYAFFDRNFSDYGLHYFNMQVDFYFQLLKRFHPDRLTQTLRASVRNFIKYTNLDTFECLSQVYDFTVACDPTDNAALRSFARQMRREVDERSRSLHTQGEYILRWLTGAFQGESGKFTPPRLSQLTPTSEEPAFPAFRPIPYHNEANLSNLDLLDPTQDRDDLGDLLDGQVEPLTYTEFKRLLNESGEQNDQEPYRLEPVLS
jgi:anaerobic magnesium-protoporphyrin IX monomethyl ester cyclase